MKRSVIVLLCALSVTAPALASEGESSFTPTSFYVPVHSVRLTSTTSNLTSELYRCASDPDPRFPNGGSGGATAGAGGAPGTIAMDADAGTDTEVLPATCLVDMADNTALAALFAAPIEIMLGTYDQVLIDQCSPGAHGYSSFVKGKISLSGQSWYTTSGNGLVLTTVGADNRHVQTDYNGCGSTIKLPAPVTVDANNVVTINAFFSLKNIAWATLTSNGPPGGCAFDTQNHNVCTGYPIPVASLGADSPTLDTYYVTEDVTDLSAQKAGGQLLLLRNAAGIAFGGFSRRLYSAHSVNPSVNYDTPIKTLTRNPDGMTYLIENWGGGGPGGTTMVPYYVHFPAFELRSHEGTFTRSDGVTTSNYRAVLQ